MWQDPFDELQLYMPDWHLNSALSEVDWRMKNRAYAVPPVEPIPLRDWWALMVEIVGALLLVFRRRAPKRTSSAKCEYTARRLSLREIRALPLHQVTDKTASFSLN